MKRFFLIILFLNSVHSKGQIFAELHVAIFRPKKVKVIHKYFSSLDTLIHTENNHQVLERKTEYYPNGQIKTDLQMNILSRLQSDTMAYKTYSLNPDSSIKSESIYFVYDHHWSEPVNYNSKDKYSYEIDYEKNRELSRTFDQKGKIVREKNLITKKDFTIYDFVYDSLDRLIQYVCYPVKDRRYKKQSFFLFEYDYKQVSDSIFCTSTEYVVHVSNKTWQNMQNSTPKRYDYNDPEFKLKLRPAYKVTVFNKRHEIIDERNGFRREKEAFPGHVTWTRRTYVYEYY